MTLDEFVFSSLARKSPMAHSVGLYRLAQLDAFVAVFGVMVLMERFDEGLVLVRRLLGWDAIDLTYVKINDSHQASRQAKATSNGGGAGGDSGDHGGGGAALRRSWDGVPVTPSPKASEMSASTRSRIQELVAGLDTPL
jgi:hypothetical protein